MSKILRKTAIGFALGGFLVSAYLLYVKVSGTDYVCGISTCAVVNNSKYSYFLKFPVALLGVLYYLTVLLLVIYKKLRFFLYVSIIGVLFSAYLIYIEAFVIHAWCQWCMLSAWISVVLFVLAISIRKG